MMNRRTALLALAAPALIPRTAGAQSFPTRPVRMVIPFTAGGSNDVVGRMLGDAMAQRLGQPVVVENRGGAGGVLGNDMVAKAEPDGHTMLLAGSGSFVISSLVQTRLPYDPVKDFAAICWLGASPNVITVHPSVQATNLRELQALGKARREPLRFGTPGVGTNGHALGAMIGVVLGIEMEPIHYRGTAPALNDLIAGRLDLLTNASAPLQPHIEAEKIRAIAIAGQSRSVALPNLSTSVEQGFPELDSSTWYGLLAPAGTPADRIAVLHAAAVAAMNQEDVKRRLIASGVDEIAPSPEPAHFTRLLASDRERWARVVERANLRVQ
ncbi:Bug family tripartite tricarboxylate transporter substrate binding protein [Falsiroseomonas sp. E2-1-a20]|uniref:Bug family tripartite tricarboxylate transporter substrate binding protein n=1 Tax=Falsiroseomonas sp. E2-1-a20 TaxID=3239300 RepID=UPI003F33B16C